MEGGFAHEKVYSRENSGREDGTFHPLDTATRAEAAVTIYKLLEALHM
ncbi:S-layer homology domain-containing protein [Cohnella silvisoli]